jgi:tripartite-type tricarboxylate transporter receptor subunit TctC
MTIKKEINRSRIVSVLAVSLLCIGWLHGYNVGWAADEGYPTKPIKILAPYEPGSKSDLAARIAASYLAQELKVAVVVENKAGAGGLIGASDVYRGKADGYTILGCGEAVMTIALASSPNPPFDYIKAFLPICSIGNSPNAFGVHKSSPFKDIAQFVKEAKAKPGQLSVGLPQLGSIDHLLWEVFKRAAGINTKLLPHKGTGEMISALLGKHIDMAVLSYSGFTPYVKSGEVRLLATTFPVPGSTAQTFAQAGYPKIVTSRNLFFVSAKTPRPIYEKLVSAFERTAKNPELSKKLEDLGLLSKYEGPADVTTSLKEGFETNVALIEELGLKDKPSGH